MIVLHQKVFIDTLKSRGYTLDEVSACIVRENEGTLVIDETHPAYPRAKPGLGDYVASGLSAIGVTKERVEAVVGRPCGCDGRQAAMNAAGAKYFGLSPGSTATENKG